ncbi:MAG: PatB family C-S lyase [Desulfovibrionaceae bacterium]|nr:PatB family C-S lyase [Desulfovibrionaceae bacterium]
MKYDFDEIIDRTGTNALSVDGFRQYIFHADETMQFGREDSDFVRMWVADMEFATPPFVLDAVRARLERRIIGYTEVHDPAYYRTFADWTERRYSWRCKKEHLFTAPGVVPAINELVSWLVNKDEQVLFLTPSYPYFKYAAELAGCGWVCSDLMEEDGRFAIDFADFAAKAGDKRTTLCILCNPHNPSGRVWTEAELRRIGTICLENGLTVISDEIHCDLLRQGQRHIPLASLFPDTDRIITCMAPSKTFNMAGFMLAHIVIPDERVRKIWQERHYGCENPLSLAAAQAAYAHGDEWLDELRAYLDGNFRLASQYLAEHLPEARFRIPEATYLAWVDISAYCRPDTDLCLFFARHGVLLEAGPMFVSNDAGHIRLNLACPRALVKKGLERICRALTE